MNKFTVPAVLGVILVIAVSLTMIPVERAVTIHSSINTSGINTNIDQAETSINANVDAAESTINANVDSESEQGCEQILSALNAENVVSMNATQIANACT